MELLLRHSVVLMAEQQMVLGIAPAEAVECDAVGVQIDLGAHDPVQPIGRRDEGAAEDKDAALGIAAAQEDDLARGGALQVEPPVRRDRRARGRLLDALGQLRPARRDEASGLLAHLRQRLEGEALPDLALPQPVEAFDRGLPAGLVRGWRKRG